VRFVLDYHQSRAGEKIMKFSAVLLMLASLQHISMPASAAESLGRLFFTPAQRAQLDNARNQKSRATLPSEQEALPLPETITYSGMVRRNDGKSTVWLNNRAINDRQPVDGVPVVGRVRPDGRIVLDTTQAGNNVELKVGQSVDIVSGTIEEPYARRATAPKSKPGVIPGSKTQDRPGRGDESGSADPAAGAPASDTGNVGGVRKGN
jgi:hypothetical protein